MSLIIFCVGIWQTGLLSGSQRSSMAFTAEFKGEEGLPNRALCDSAQKYWNAYPDVAQDAFFGLHGTAGCQGAYEHWTRHGRQEGRVWGVTLP